MRVIAGVARGRVLAAPPGTATRPTSDRVREAVFNALGSAGLVDGATVLDLFAGSGALGIEALSRGAGRVTFVESSRPAVKVVRANLGSCGFEEVGRVEATTVERFLGGAAPGLAVDLAFVDPPYAYAEWTWLLDVLPARHVVVESNRVVGMGEEWDVLRQRSYGGTVVQIASRRTLMPRPNPQESKE